MELGFDKARLKQYQALISRLLGDPVKMRLAVIGLAVVVGLGIYMPMSDRIAQARGELLTEQGRLDKLAQIESLRLQAKPVRDKIGDASDTNDWVQFLLAGSRQCQVRLRDMETKPSEKVGPYKTVGLSIELEGLYPQLKSFIQWLETSDRVLRIETVRFERVPSALVVKVYVLGLVKSK